MVLRYEFFDRANDEWDDGDIFEYEVDDSDLIDFIDDTLSDLEKLDLYVTEIYNKSEDERENMEETFGVKNLKELMDYYNSNPSMFDWLSEALAEDYTTCEYIFRIYEDELKERFEEEAYDEYQNQLSISETDDMIMRDYWRTRI